MNFVVMHSILLSGISIVIFLLSWMSYSMNEVKITELKARNSTPRPYNEEESLLYKAMLDSLAYKKFFFSVCVALSLLVFAASVLTLFQSLGTSL